MVACSTDSHFSHLAWVNTPRKQGGLGSMNIPLLADKTGEISKAYGVYKEDEGNKIKFCDVGKSCFMFCTPSFLWLMK